MARQRIRRGAGDVRSPRGSGHGAAVLVAAIALSLPGAGGIALAQDSPHGSLSFACEECHSADSWKEMPVPAKFDHSKTGFALKGQHDQVKCMECHTSLTFGFAKSSSRCADCHEDVHRGELGPACDRCHSPQSWLVPDMIQRHASTRFSLVGIHATVPCQECHTNEQKNEFTGLRTDCFGCHVNDYNASQAPNHRQSGLGTDCQSCHAVNAVNWGVIGVTFGGSFDHAKTGFPLVGAHAAIPCMQCHAGNRFGPSSTTCLACHALDFANAAAPPHAGFPADCTTCHTMTAWQPATFDHNTTPFPLTGGHAGVTCQQCHVNNVFAGLTTDCYTCHTSTFASAAAPVPHAGFPTACASCHTTNPGWSPSTYSHASASPHFPQDSRHTSPACASCHQTATNYTQFCCQSSGCHNSCAGGGG